MKKKIDYKFMLVIIYTIEIVASEAIVVMCKHYFAIYFLVLSRKSFILLKFYDCTNLAV